MFNVRTIPTRNGPFIKDKYTLSDQERQLDFKRGSAFKNQSTRIFISCWGPMLTARGLLLPYEAILNQKRSEQFV